jgi:hypothetical protein
VLRVVNIIMSIGTNEHNDANQSMGAWRTDEQALSEGAVGGELHTGVLGTNLRISLPSKYFLTLWKKNS